MFVAEHKPLHHGAEKWLIGTLSPQEQRVHGRMVSSGLLEHVSVLRDELLRISFKLVSIVVWFVSFIPVSLMFESLLVGFMATLVPPSLFWLGLLSYHAHQERVIARYNKLCKQLAESDRLVLVGYGKDKRWTALLDHDRFNHRLAAEYKDVVDDYLCDPEVIRINQLLQHTRPKPSQEQESDLRKALRVKANAAVKHIHALEAPQRKRRRLQRREAKRAKREAKRLAALEAQADQTVFDEEVAEVIRHVNEQ